MSGSDSVSVVVDVSPDQQVLARVTERLRAMSEGALTRPRSDLNGASVAEAVHALCAWAAAASGESAPVPLLHPVASGDQLMVIGREFLAWAEVGSGDGAAAVERWRSELDLIRRAA